ncbi:monocarboxylate transporter 6-like [Trichoplusia ni]|uniref:Monocarboxylate transporter 6-like n=1 Tax=Trichoplusia ni TaxID=7111 RepID=A0A7E5WBV5_TRINI|nr:monocarboxylate transporter 6-like [Trichoplusia ni]
MSRPPKNIITTKANDTKRSILVVPSKVCSNAEEPELEGVEETEIAAQITVPEEGGWGWLVVAASFFCIFVLDGVYFTFGSIFHDMAHDLAVEESLVALINSIAVAVYFVGGPFVSALINRFGFRACTMSGSIIGSIALLCSYFCLSYATVLLFYGFIGGFGACLVSMSSGLIVGFYFERLRSLAMSIASVGSSVGIMIMFTVNTQLVRLAGWRVTTLFHCGLFGSLYFVGMVFRPLLSLTVTKTTEDPTRTVTYLPSLAAIKASPSRVRKEGVMPTGAERLFSAVSNVHFPTAANVVKEGIVTKTMSNQAGPSAVPVGMSRLTVTAQGPSGGISQRQLNKVKSMMSKTSVQERTKEPLLNVEVNLKVEPQQKLSCWQRLCHWEEHVPQSRPMYRDDAFYGGKLENLPAYQKSVLDTSPEARTGLEYQMAVSRAVTAVDLSEKRGVFTTAVRRILATMMDPKLLKKISFILFCTSGFFTYLGYLVPYVFLPDRNLDAGIAPQHCSLFVSVIGFANAVGRLVIGALACKYSPLKLYMGACLIAGFGIIAFNLSFNVYYQYFCCIVFGFHIASLSSIRSMVIVNLYGLDMLTNATGMMLMFQGIGSLLSTPLSSVLKNQFGYAVSFYVAGAFVLISGFILLPLKKINDREKQAEEKKNASTDPKPPEQVVPPPPVHNPPPSPNAPPQPSQFPQPLSQPQATPYSQGSQYTQQASQHTQTSQMAQNPKRNMNPSQRGK